MNNGVLITCAVLSLPAGWFAGVLYDRIPDRESLFRPVARPRLTRPYLDLHLLTLGLFVVAGWKFHDAHPLVLAAYLVFFTAVVALAAIDVNTMRLPDAIVVPLIMVSIVLVSVASILAKNAPGIRYALIGGGFYFGFLLLAHLAFPRGMGFGDVKLSAVMGLMVGWVGTDIVSTLVVVLYAMIAGFVVGAFVGMIVFAFRRKSKPIPFGPFLIFGCIVVIVFSHELLPTPIL